MKKTMCFLNKSRNIYSFFKIIIKTYTIAKNKIGKANILYLKLCPIFKLIKLTNALVNPQPGHGI